MRELRFCSAKCVKNWRRNGLDPFSSGIVSLPQVGLFWPPIGETSYEGSEETKTAKTEIALTSFAVAAFGLLATFSLLS